jgi:uncharacterized protein (TIGR02594 family)
MGTAEIQRQLAALGFDPGPVDGISGRRTIAAVMAFQRAHPPLAIDGIAGPKTLAVMFTAADGVPAWNGTAKPWFDLALTKKGLHEQRDVAELRRFLKSDGRTLGDPRVMPWCGDFIETCIAVSLPHEPLPVNPYLARNWLKFGRPCAPTLGAVMVYWRGSKSGYQGHVAFYAGENGPNFYNLGGNQSNAIKVAPLAKGRLLGARWPLSAPMPGESETVAMTGGILSINEV